MQPCGYFIQLRSNAVPTGLIEPTPGHTMLRDWYVLVGLQLAMMLMSTLTATVMILASTVWGKRSRAHVPRDGILKTMGVLLAQKWAQDKFVVVCCLHSTAGRSARCG